ncbi:hypothetical protein EMIHUDRAFT_198177 [Emiliania huxleyi CCMP1516]|uniref:Uncharacterized protein n=2 Tax=Emiliania huxleyi TaxID=2903 RepID=A0A0D3IED9_EMIH1|nr:hypothetical protein EMIHUDRAFT_198177 [Emiliania huxleyi CCMP1516]EOD09624.1 hypothetical protein EMIHUDRAFT_198177 [Emiliania huxleyi CCMP1516]|eukprot:XP_005762053.1 hypothetical protein EMIHUDRAFT_198177 [Emiliania huxleyi CCMP1516]
MSSTSMSTINGISTLTVAGSSERGGDNEADTLKSMLAQERELFQKQVAALRKQLSDEHSDNVSIKKVLQMQQMQMQMLAKQNESILNDLKNLRDHMPADQSTP